MTRLHKIANPLRVFKNESGGNFAKSAQANKTIPFSFLIFQF